MEDFFPRPRSLTDVRTPRPTCYDCIRPLPHCVCTLVTPFVAHTNFLILQHPHERKKYCATTKVVMKAVRNVKLIRGVEFNPSEIWAVVESQTPYLLYPGPDAKDCGTVTVDRSSTVIVIDGTWDEAQKIMHRNRFLREVPKISFSAPPPSAYRIRRQPKKNCLSTLESIAYFLERSAPGAGISSGENLYRGLLDAFDEMVNRQIAYWPSSVLGKANA